MTDQLPQGNKGTGRSILDADYPPLTGRNGTPVNILQAFAQV
jgi:hypothetical protein